MQLRLKQSLKKEIHIVFHRHPQHRSKHPPRPRNIYKYYVWTDNKLQKITTQQVRWARVVLSDTDRTPWAKSNTQVGWWRVVGFYYGVFGCKPLGAIRAILRPSKSRSRMREPVKIRSVKQWNRNLKLTNLLEGHSGSCFSARSVGYRRPGGGRHWHRVPLNPLCH